MRASKESASSKSSWMADTFMYASLPRPRGSSIASHFAWQKLTPWSRDRAIEAYLDAVSGVLALARELTDDEWWAVRPTFRRGTSSTTWPTWSPSRTSSRGVPVPSSIHRLVAVPARHDAVPAVHRGGRRGTPRMLTASEELMAELEALVEERSRQLSVGARDVPDAEMRGPAGMVGPVAAGDGHPHSRRVGPRAGRPPGHRPTSSHGRTGGGGVPAPDGRRAASYRRALSRLRHRLARRSASYVAGEPGDYGGDRAGRRRGQGRFSA